MTVTVIGDAVTMAARLQERSRRYGALILASNQTVDSLADPARYHYRLLDRINLHGEHEPILVSEILDAHPLATRDLMVETALDFAQGLTLCHARSFAEACVHFNRVLERNPDDQAARRHLHRAARAMAHGLSGQPDVRTRSESGYDEEIESFRL